MLGVGRLALSSFGLRRNANLTPKLQAPEKRRDKKDLVSFLEALNSVLDGRPWLDCTFVNALEGDYLGGGATFIVRRHIVQRRIHSPPHRKVPGDVVVLKIARDGFSDGQISSEDTTTEQIEALIREILILTHPPVRSSPSIVDLLKLLFEFDGGLLRPVLILEYADIGTLSDFLHSENMVGLDTKDGFCKDIARGLHTLHKSGIVHGDIKCDNVLLFRTDNDEIAAKLTDFGFSTLLSEVENGSSVKVGGTDPFRAPEAEEAVPKTMIHKTDYYSLGMLVWQMLLPGCPDPFACSPFDIHLGVGSATAWKRDVLRAKQSPDFLDDVMTSLRTHCHLEENSPFERMLCQLLCYSPGQRNAAAALDTFDSSIASDFL